MDAMLIRLSCDQRSNARSTSFSAAETFSGSVFVFILFHLSRIVRSRSRNCAPWVTAFRSSTIRAARSLHASFNGVMTNRSATNRPTPAAATTASICWRFLICIASPFSPMKVEGELQGCRTARLLDVDFPNPLRRAQFVAHLQQGLIVARRARTSHHRQITDFHGLGRHSPVFGKRLREFAQNAQVAERAVEPGSKSADLLLQVLQLFHLRCHGRPLRLQP